MERSSMFNSLCDRLVAGELAVIPRVKGALVSNPRLLPELFPFVLTFINAERYAADEACRLMADLVFEIFAEPLILAHRSGRRDLKAFFPYSGIIVEADRIVREVFNVACHKYVYYDEPCTFCINLLKNSAYVNAIFTHWDVLPARNDVRSTVACTPLAVNAWIRASQSYRGDSMLLQSLAQYALSHPCVQELSNTFFDQHPGCVKHIVADVVDMLGALFELPSVERFGDVLCTFPIITFGMLDRGQLWLEAMSSADFIRWLIRTLRFCIGRSITEEIQRSALDVASQCLGLWRSLLEYEPANVVAAAHHHGLIEIVRLVERVVPLRSDFHESILGILSALSDYSFYPAVCRSLCRDLSRTHTRWTFYINEFCGFRGIL
ncbi:hypothetical protein BDZ89DRAFT_1054171 [Hymenopellis radicata]|nr:hypothetical protein BDZ89DRAFT_1054171 [Hymenopellis radicata]